MVQRMLEAKRLRLLSLIKNAAEFTDGAADSSASQQRYILVRLPAQITTFIISMPDSTSRTNQYTFGTHRHRQSPQPPTAMRSASERRGKGAPPVTIC